jgi:non-homologous end joining protein Ku
MASRPIWRGHLRLALVSCPVALFNARHDRASIRFNMINPETGNGSGKILVYQAAMRSFASGFSRPSNTAARTTATR